jgi:carbon monoxide dehydrogenase subunit G
MQMSGERRIPAPREKVWEALNDPEVLKQSIPGCQSLEKDGDDSFSAKVKAKVGPVSATFAGAVTLSDMNPPESYRLSGEGKGGAAGFAKGGASVKLEEDGSDTILKYDVDAKVGGKLAQIGSRLVDGTARKLSEEFFDNFSAIVGGGGAAAPASEEPQAEAAEPTPAEEPAAQETASEEPVAPAPAAAAPAEPQPEASSGSATPDRKGLPAIVWIAGLVAAVAALLYLFTAN